LRKITPIVVVLLFALAGASSLWSGVTSISKGIKADWPGDRDDIYSGLVDLAFGTALISVAYGLHRRDYRVRTLAIILTGLGLVRTLVAAIALTVVPRIPNLSGLWFVLFVFALFASELFVLVWLLLPSVRKQFLYNGRPREDFSNGTS
jgi:hypothetical protein